MRFRRQRIQLEAAPPGLGDFLATVHVKFPIPIPDAENPSDTPTQGYYRNFGVRAAPGRVHVVLEGLVSDGIIDWEGTKWDLVDPTTLGNDIRDQIEPTVGEGVWYRTGRLLYADPDLEPPTS